MKEFITIVTPTYNRAYILPKLFESLIVQTNKNFKWLVIDDGSNDNTTSLVKDFSQKADFEIIYIKKDNGGKHTALNLAFKKVDTYLTFIVDSDDILTPNAIEFIYKYVQKIKDSNLSGVCFLKAHYNGKCAGKKFPLYEQIDNDFCIRLKKGCNGDKAEAFRTDILRQYQFPVFEGEKFIGENYVWWQIAQKYNMIYVNEIIYFCEYLEDGLTKAWRRLQLQNPLGGMEVCKIAFSANVPLKLKIKQALLFGASGYQAGWSITKIINSTDKCKMLVIACLLPAKFIQVFWRWKYL